MPPPIQGLPAEAYALFLKMQEEAKSKGSMLGALKYLHAQVSKLADQLGAQIAAVEGAELARREIEADRRKAVEGL